MLCCWLMLVDGCSLYIYSCLLICCHGSKLLPWRSNPDSHTVCVFLVSSALFQFDLFLVGKKLLSWYQHPSCEMPQMLNIYGFHVLLPTLPSHFEVAIKQFVELQHDSTCIAACHVSSRLQYKTYGAKIDFFPRFLC